MNLPPIGWTGALTIVACMALWWFLKASYYGWWPFDGRD